MMDLQFLLRSVSRKLTFVVAFALVFCGLLVFPAEVRANGNVSADAPVPAEEPSVRRPARRAPVRRPARKAPAKTAKQQVPPEPDMPTSLEIGIMMMEQERYEHARLWLQKAVQEERGNPYAWYWYGMAHDKSGQYSQAQFFYARALELDPAFPPFARVVAYPDDGDRKALWDPLRPARVYPVELGSRGVAIVPPDAPEATHRPLMPYVDPTLPKVPVYVPPEAPSYPGDAIQPPVYVPPNFTEQPPVYVPVEHMEPPPPAYMPHPAPAQTEAAPVYTPPAPEKVRAAPVQVAPTPPTPPAVRQTTEAPVYTPPQPPATGQVTEAPVYTPPPPVPEQAETAPAQMPSPPAATQVSEAPVYMPPPPPASGQATEAPVYTPPPPSR